MEPHEQKDSSLGSDILSRMKQDLLYLIPKHCQSYDIGEFKQELFLHSSSRIEYATMDIIKVDRFISIVYKYWDYFLILVGNLSFNEETVPVIYSEYSIGAIDVQRTREERLTERYRVVVSSTNKRDPFIAENTMVGATILGLNLLAKRFLEDGQHGHIHGFRSQHFEELKRIINFSDYLLKDRLVEKLVAYYLQNYENTDQLLSRLAERSSLGQINNRYDRLLWFVREWLVFDWMLSAPNALHEVLTRELDSLRDHKLYELWIFYSILDTFGPVRQSYKNKNRFFNDDDGISIEYHWQQKIGWQLVKQTTHEPVEVKRYPDVIIRKNGKNIVVIDAKCMRYTEKMDDKQEPGPQRDIVNQMLIYLEYAEGPNLGIVLFADEIEREDIEIRQGQSRKILFLSCYPYTGFSKKVLGRIKQIVS